MTVRTGTRKQKTQQRILREASHAFRAEGVAGIGIAGLMARAGLTHGGFYAHFENKEALVTEACRDALHESTEKLAAIAAKAPPGGKTQRVIQRYLTPRHRDLPAEGCPMPSLAGEIARESAPVRRAFTAGFERYVTQLVAIMASDASAIDDDQALVLISGMAGALLLARAVDDPELSERILTAARTFYEGAFAPPCDESKSTPGTLT